MLPKPKIIRDDAPAILVFAPLFPTANSPESFVNGKLALALLRSGYHVTVISFHPETLGGESSSDESTCWNGLQAITYEVSHKEGARLTRAICHLNEKFLKVGLAPYLLWSWNAYRMGSKLLNQQEYSVILSRCQPIWAHLPALLLSSLRRLPWIANWNDPTPISRYPKPYGDGPKARLSLLTRALFRLICDKAAWHTFPCDRLKTYMNSYMPRSASPKSSTVPHISISHLNAGKMAPKRQAQLAKFRLCHSGSIHFRNWSEFLDGCRVFLSQIEVPSQIEIVFIGWQPLEPFLTRLHELDLEGVVSIAPTKSFENSVEFLNEFDVLIVIEAGCEEGIFLPSKIADYASVARPILAVSPRVGTLSDLVHNHGGGVTTDCTAPTDIARGLRILYESWATNSLHLDFNPTRLYSAFSEQNVLKLYRDIFSRILQRTHREE